MEKGSMGLRLSRLAIGVLFTSFGIWASARIILQLQAAEASWPDWLILLFPAVPLAIGVLFFAIAARNAPDALHPFMRYRTGAARIFGSVSAGFYVITITLNHLFRQKALGGVLIELVSAAIIVGLLTLLYGAINAGLADQEQQASR